MTDSTAETIERTARDSAKQMVKLGFEVVRHERPGLKHPGFEGWPTAGVSSAEDVHSWPENFNYSVLLDGYTVIDFDPRNMGVPPLDGELEGELLTWFAIDTTLSALGIWPTMTVYTGGGGLHAYVKGELDVSSLGPGIDVKSGHGQQVVGPGSMHESGERYSFGDFDPEILGAPSGDLVAKVHRSNGVSTRGSEGSAALTEDGFVEGGRNDGVFRQLCRERALGKTDAEIRGWGSYLNASQVHPPLGADELDVIIERALRYEPGSEADQWLGIDPVAIERRVETGDVSDRFRLYTGVEEMSQVLNEEVDWLVRDIIPADGVGQIIGKSFTGKSYLAIDLAMSLANGRSHWSGHEIDAGGPVDVIYMLLEGQGDFLPRIKAWLQEHEGDDQHFHLCYPQGFNAMRADEFEGFAAGFRAKGVDPALVIIDTQSLAKGGADENSNSDMVELFTLVKQFSQQFDCLTALRI